MALEAAPWVALTLVLLAFYLSLYPYRGFRLPVGSDAPVYLWWSRLAGHDHLGAVGVRAGLPALALVLAGSLRVSLVVVLAGLGAALGAATGLAAAALVRTGASDLELEPGPRVPVLAGLLAGAFAVHLADGYFANLAFAVVFLGALALLGTGTRRGQFGAAGLLAAGALAHPPFFLAGAAILILAALPTILWRPPGTRVRDTEGAGVVGATLAAGLIGAAGLSSLLLESIPYRPDTSKDAFLRRLGFGADLRSDYVDRLVRHLARYWLPISVPLGAAGALTSGGFLGRSLRAWGVVMVAGVVGSLATGLAPADRFLAFGYVLPIGSALGLAWLWRRLRRSGTRASALGVVLSAALIVVMLGGAAVTWLRARPFLSPAELRAAGAATRAVQSVPRGTPLVFVVDNRRPTLSFLAARAGNIIRAAVPPDRIRDVYLYVGSPARYLAGEPTLLGRTAGRDAVIHDALSRESLRQIRAAGGRPLGLDLRPFDPTGFDSSQRSGIGTRVGPGAVVLGSTNPSRRAARAPEDVVPAPSWGIVAAGVGLFLALGAAGLGWSLAATDDPLNAVALAPATGTAALLLGGLIADRMGVALSAGPALAVGISVALAGYLASFLIRRRRPAARSDGNASPSRIRPALERRVRAQAPDEPDQ